MGSVGSVGSVPGIWSTLPMADGEALKTREAWRAYCRTLAPSADLDTLLADVGRYLDVGLDPQTVARLLRLRTGRASARDVREHDLEGWHLQRSRHDLEMLRNLGRISEPAAAALDTSLLAQIA